MSSNSNKKQEEGRRSKKLSRKRRFLVMVNYWRIWNNHGVQDWVDKQRHKSHKQFWLCSLFSASTQNYSKKHFAKSIKDGLKEGAFSCFVKQISFEKNKPFKGGITEMLKYTLKRDLKKIRRNRNGEVFYILLSLNLVLHGLADVVA